MTEEKKGEGFVIKDKRFSEENNAKEEPAAAKEPDVKEKVEKPAHDPMDYPPVNFTNFVISLSTSAFFHFGDFPEYEGGKAEKNLPAAKQTIDILDMLNEKTKGNLDQNEASLIQGVLYELKMRYVKEKG
ncbi:MAG: DUF1844 domain-containing protein [Smithella sp.]|jgi:hypothetical protein